MEIQQKLQDDLEKYRKMALDAGAVEARIVPASDLKQSIRAKYNCFFPRCQKQGTCGSCPPEWQTPWEYAKAILASYRYGIVARIQLIARNSTGPHNPLTIRPNLELYRKYMPAEKIDYWENLAKEQEGHITAEPITELPYIIERKAREDGHYFAFTIHPGACAYLCAETNYTCSSLGSSICIHPGLSRGGNQSIYWDHVGINRSLGWKNWNQGWSIFGEDQEAAGELIESSIVLIE
jgi:predicted metal-binding protein